jgi:hypothetical protein
MSEIVKANQTKTRLKKAKRGHVAVKGDNEMLEFLPLGEIKLENITLNELIETINDTVHKVNNLYIHLSNMLKGLEEQKTVVILKDGNINKAFNALGKDVLVLDYQELPQNVENGIYTVLDGKIVTDKVALIRKDLV